MNKKLLAWPFLTLFLAACVTINIYFPAAAAEEAARTIVRDVLGEKPEAKPVEEVPGGDKSSALKMDQMLLVMVGRTLEFMVPVAEAGQANININTPVISRLRKSMAARQGRLSGFYRSGAIGFDQRGLVATRDMGSVALRSRNQLKKLLADENRDRNALYREIARANKHPEWEKDVRATFAKVWVEEAPRGYWYKTSGGQWRQK